MLVIEFRLGCGLFVGFVCFVGLISCCSFVYWLCVSSINVIVYVGVVVLILLWFQFLFVVVNVLWICWVLWLFAILLLLR